MAQDTEAPARALAGDRSAVAERSISSDVLSMLQERLPFLVAQLTRRINIDQVTAESGTSDNVTINKMTLGDATIESLTLSNVAATLQGSQAFLENVRTVLELHFTFQWEVDLGWLGSWGDTNDLGSINIPVNVGNVSIPSLANIQFNIPTATVTNAKAHIDPISNLALGPAHFGKITVNDTDAPSEGFNITGMSVGDVNVNKIGIPKTNTTSANIASITPDRAITLPQATITGASLPAVQVGTINAGGFGFPANASRRTLEIDLGILDFKLNIDPIMHLNVGAMTIRDASFAVALGRMDARNITVPIKIEGVNVQKLGLNSLKINQIRL